MEKSSFEFIVGIGQILAVALIPVIIWLFGIKYQNRKAKKDAKLNLFLTLMANRKKTILTNEWVDSLNVIDVVFQDDKEVRNAWRDYFDSLHPQSINNADSRLYLLTLLSEMAKSLGYKKLKQTDIDHFYVPQGHNSQHSRQELIESEKLRILLNSKSLAETFSHEEFQNNYDRLSGNS